MEALNLDMDDNDNATLAKPVRANARQRRATTKQGQGQRQLATVMKDADKKPKKRPLPKKYVAQLVKAASLLRRPSSSSRGPMIKVRRVCGWVRLHRLWLWSDFLALKFCGLPCCAKCLICSDIKERDNRTAPGCDLFITGAPCQAYSTAGQGAGLDDGKDRGVAVFYSLHYVRHKRPKVVMIENVRGLTFKRHKHVGRYPKGVGHTGV